MMLLRGRIISLVFSCFLLKIQCLFLVIWLLLFLQCSASDSLISMMGKLILWVKLFGNCVNLYLKWQQNSDQQQPEKKVQKLPFYDHVTRKFSLDIHYQLTAVWTSPKTRQTIRAWFTWFEWTDPLRGEYCWLCQTRRVCMRQVNYWQRYSGVGGGVKAATEAWG